MRLYISRPAMRTVAGYALASIGLAVAGAADTRGEDYKPRVCEAAVAYQGPPLHAPLAVDAFAGAAGALDGSLPAALTKQLDTVIEQILQKTGAPAVTAAVGIPGEGIWSTTRGVATLAPRTELPTPAYFHWASVGKAFTAAIVAQLVDEGRLRFDDPLAKWFADYPNAQAITIDHLLTHTAGIFSFNTDLPFRRVEGKYHPPHELIAIARRHGNFSCPGENWSYSNTGYVLLGQILEMTEGRPLHEIVARRILSPLQLQHTVALVPQAPPAGLLTGHVQGKIDRQFEPTTPFAAGMIAGTADDMVRFWQAILTARLYSQSARFAAFDKLYPMFQQPGLFYGRGVMLFEFPDGAQSRQWLGHSGGTPGIKTVVAYDTAAKLFVAAAWNGDVSAEATANALLKAVTAYRAKP